MNRNIFLFAVAVLSIADGVMGGGGKKGQQSGWEAPENVGWGWSEDKPAYDINPHFGFRQYSEMRYEPLTVPFLYGTQLTGPPAPTQALAPVFNGQGPPYSSELPGPIKYIGHSSQTPSLPYPLHNLLTDGYVTRRRR